MSKNLPNSECCPFLQESIFEASAVYGEGFRSEPEKCLVTDEQPIRIVLHEGRRSHRVRCCRLSTYNGEIVKFQQCADYSRAVYGLTREWIREAVEKGEPIHEIVQATLAKEVLRLIHRVVGDEEK